MTLTTTVKVEQKFSAQAKDCANKKASEKLWILIHKPELNVHPKMTGNRKKKTTSQWRSTVKSNNAEMKGGKKLTFVSTNIDFSWNAAPG